MDSIPIVTTRQALPFTDFLDKAGAPTPRLLEKAGLPVRLLDRTDGYIAEIKLWEYLDIADRDQGLEHFGLEVGKDIRLAELGGMDQSFIQAPTLHAGVAAFAALAIRESSHANFWLETGGGQEWFCRGGLPGKLFGRRHVELYVVQLMVSLVRLVTSPQWRPRHVRLQTTDLHGLDGCELLSGSDISEGWAYTAIAILQLPVLDNGPAHTAANDSYHATTLEDRLGLPMKEGLAASLKRLLTLYVGDGPSPNLQTAADICQMHPRKLQRILRTADISFSELLCQVRFEMTLPLLGNPDASLLEIGYSVGYSDPAHFSNAFRRWTGMSPKEYRRGLMK